MAPVRIALVGAAGRMGLEIVRAAQGRVDIQIGSAVEHAGCLAIGSDLGSLAGEGVLGVAVSDDLNACLGAADVAVDLSLASATADVARAAAETGTPLVSGTTGIDDLAREALAAAAKKVAVLHTPNLSLGVAVTRSLVEHAVEALGDGYDVEVVEMHHNQKADAPSGTALALAEAAAGARGLELEKAARHGRVGHTGARGAGEIGVHALRGGGVFGEHTVILAGRHERVEITHRASSRALFAEGALRVALFLHDKPAGLYTMADTL